MTVRATFMEKLPPACPPVDAVRANYDAVWRFVTSNPPTDVDFHSHAMLKKRLPPGQDLCRWSSCSLFLSSNRSYKSLPKPRKKYKYIARLKISHLCGYTHSNGKHVDFWRFEGVDPNVTQVIPL